MDHMELFRILPKTNCGECRHTTCLAFAKLAAYRKAAISDCPYIAASCPCGHAQETPFRKCPSCGASAETLRKEWDSMALACPKCGYSQDECFSECPACGVTVAACVRTARKKGQPAAMEPAAAAPPAGPGPTGKSAPSPAAGPPSPPRTKEIVSHQCPYCGYVTTYTMPDCPGCGYSGGPGFDGKP
ncbi:MAG: (Fe-S)-binding protein [Thermodesulfobacteriota bacterium]